MFNFFSKFKNKQNIDYVLVGLGNPGSKYKNTRHNAGFIAIDHIISTQYITNSRVKFNAKVCETTIGSKRVLLVKPQTYMNLSGDTVAQVANFHKIQMEKFVIISDDISLPVGKMRIRKKGSAGGHNGLKDIILKTGSEQFLRVKIGVGAKPEKWNLSDWVLSEFSPQERPLLDAVVQNTQTAIEMIISNKVDEAMNKFNS